MNLATLVCGLLVMTFSIGNHRSAGRRFAAALIRGVEHHMVEYIFMYTLITHLFSIYVVRYDQSAYVYVVRCECVANERLNVRRCN